MATASTVHERDRSTTTTPGGGGGGMGGGGSNALGILADALRVRRGGGRAMPVRDEVSAGRTKTRGGRAVYHQGGYQNAPIRFGRATPDERISRAQARMAEIAARDASARYAAASRPAPTKNVSFGIGTTHNTMDPSAMNAYQRELYLPQNAQGIPDSQGMQYGAQLAADRQATFDRDLEDSRRRSRFPRGVGGW